MVIKRVKVGEIKTNCYIVSENDKCFVVDPGDDIDKIIDHIGKDKLQFILLTHGHFDHVLAIEPFHELFPNIPIYISEKDEDLLRSLSEQNRYSLGELKDLKVAIKQVSKTSKIIFEGKEVKIIETPGHSHGSVCYLVDGNLFSGDTLFYHTIGRTDFWTSNHSDMISSLKKLKKLPKTIKVYPGHGRATNLEEEQRYGYLGVGSPIE